MGVMNQLVTGGHHLVWICVRMFAAKKARPEQTWGYEAASSGGTTTWSPATFEPTGRQKQRNNRTVHKPGHERKKKWTIELPLTGLTKQIWSKLATTWYNMFVPENLENGWHSNNNPAWVFQKHHPLGSPGSVHLGSPRGHPGTLVTLMDHFLLSFSGQVANIQTAEPIQIVVRPGALFLGSTCFPNKSVQSGYGSKLGTPIIGW